MACAGSGIRRRMSHSAEPREGGSPALFRSFGHLAEDGKFSTRTSRHGDPIPESGLTRAEYGFELRESIQETTGIGLPSPICSRPRSSHRHPMRGRRCVRKPGFVSVSATVSATVGWRCPALPRESGGGWAIRRSLGGAEVRLCFGASGIWRRMGNLLRERRALAPATGSAASQRG